MTVKVDAFPRLHATLIDLAGATERQYGGAGFSIGGPRTRIQVARSKDGTSRLVHRAAMDARARRNLLHVMGRVAALTGHGYEVRIDAMPTQHVGLGTKTSVLLASLVGANAVDDLRLPRETLQRLSGRGGTSGVGIHAFFSGGFIVDAGHPAPASGSFVPSSARFPKNPPLKILRVPIPTNWRFTLLLPAGKRYAGDSEREFFRINSPIARRDALECLGLVYHGLVPAVQTADLLRLRRVLDNIQSVGFKRQEVAGQTADVESLVKDMRGFDRVAVGMSSMGPLVYVVSDRNDDEFRPFLEETLARHSASSLGTVAGRNRGFGYRDD